MQCFIGCIASSCVYWIMKDFLLWFAISYSKYKIKSNLKVFDNMKQTFITNEAKISFDNIKHITEFVFLLFWNNMAEELDFDQISVYIMQYELAKIENIYWYIILIQSRKMIPSYLTVFIYFKQSPSNKKWIWVVR